VILFGQWFCIGPGQRLEIVEMNPFNLESSSGLHGEDLEGWLSGNSLIVWDEPDGLDPIVAVVPERKQQVYWDCKQDAWAEIEQTIGKRLVEKCNSLQEAVWHYLGKVPFELFIGDTASQDANQYLLLTDDFGNKLRYEVREMPLSIRRIADESGVNRVSLARFMKGKTDLSLSAASRLAEYCGLELVHTSRINQLKKDAAEKKKGKVVKGKAKE
jgi:hypothetical protein